MHSPLFGLSALLLLFHCCSVCGFHDESIFEDEDIYTQALPPAPQTATGTTLPGTKWCGPGNTAANFSDLGVQHEADWCCREHDHCEEILEPQTTLHGLNNTDWFPILKCSCEQTFINCLQRVNNMVSNSLGRIYFGTRGKCFAYAYPVTSCKQYHEGTFRKRCIRYNVDKKRPQVWQFLDMPFYSNSMAALKANANPAKQETLHRLH